MIADIILHDVPYLSPYDLVEKYELYSSLKEVTNDVLYCMWNTCWNSNNTMCLYDNHWVSLTFSRSLFTLRIKIGVSYIILMHDCVHNVCFKNTEYNLRLLREYVAE